MCGLRKLSNLDFFCMELSSSLNTFNWRGCLSPIVYFYFLCHRLIAHRSVDSFLDLLLCPIDLCVHFLFVCQHNAILIILVSFVVVIQSLSHIWLFATPWTAAHQTSLSFTISLSLLRLLSIESEMPSNHLILCHPLLLLPSVFPSIWVFSNDSALHIRWPKY